MDKLRNLIFEVRSRNENIDGRYFVADQDLRDVMTQVVVREALLDQDINQNSRLEPYYIDHAANIIASGAQKIFAILVLIDYTKAIRQFIENDNYQSSSLDHGLPYDKVKLRAFLPNERLVTDFFEKQWHFTTPVFSDSVFHRVLPRETILPIIEQDWLSSGGFGEVYSIEIPSSHQRFNNGLIQSRELVRKEFRPRDESEAEYKRELHNLSILKLLHHPNIIELLSSYSYNNKFNFVFPRACGGTLATLLASPRPVAFGSNSDFIIALSGLCSAVRAVHRFVSHDHQLEFIGCHHDLKPTNILIQDSRFLLADFGLSRFKEPPEESETPSRIVHPYYTPPECYMPDHSSEKPVVHRWSDIWSFGCIIAEVLAYMLGGAEGVRQFERQRKFQDGKFTRSRFHRGGAEHPAVAKWLKDKQQSSSRVIRMLGNLVGDTLNIQPQERPCAREVEARMCSIGIYSHCEPIQKLYEDVCNESKSIQAILERTRFQSWAIACNDPAYYHSRDNPSRWSDGEKYQFIIETLRRVQSELSTILGHCENIQSRIFQPLRQLNNLLLDSLTNGARRMARTWFDIEMMHTVPDLPAMSRLSETELGDAGTCLARRIGIFAAVKCITEVSQERSDHDGLIDYNQLGRMKRIGDFQISHLADKKGRILIESKAYQMHHGDKNTAKELHERLENITALLKQANHGAGEDKFRVLPCAGFYQDAATYSCGLVYEFPSSSPDLQFITLRLALESTRYLPQSQPSLGERFQLARTLAVSVLHFHKVSWLQKSISSYNITFFHAKEEPWLREIERPFFVGFLYSRHNDTKAFTEGPTEDTAHQEYQHPEYRGKKSRYRVEYDYYSLGLVLLEIGLWKSLGEITQLLKTPESKTQAGKTQENYSEKLLPAILKKCVPLLRVSMGSRYQQVVEICLRGDFRVSDDTGEGDERYKKLHLSFARLVVEELANFLV